jgi:hypothetical protein
MGLKPGNNLQEVVDTIREDLKDGFGGFWRLHGDGIPKEILLEVKPDGVTWLVGVSIGSDYKEAVVVDPKEFINNLYVLVVQWLREATEKKKAVSTAAN